MQKGSGTIGQYSHDDYMERLRQNGVLKKFEVLGQYTSSRNDIQVKCKQCGDIHYKTAGTLSRGDSAGCKQCASDARRMSHKDFIQRLQDTGVLDRYEILSDYTDHDNGVVLTRCKKCGVEKAIRIKVLLNKRQSNIDKDVGCFYCKRKITQEDFETIIRENGVLDKFELIDKLYTGYESKMRFRCKICGHSYEKRARALLDGDRCACEAGNRTVVGVNNIASASPWLQELLLNKEDGYKYGKSSDDMIQWVCPDCGKINESTIKAMTRHEGNRCNCKFCSDGISFPEKFFIHLLDSLDIEFETQKTPEWGHVVISCKSHSLRYDFYIPEYKLYVELDGHFHDRAHPRSKLNIEDIQLIDHYKTVLPTAYGNNFIRIDCRESSVKYIKNKILLSKFAEYYDCRLVDWDECGRNAIKSNAVRAAKMWNSRLYGTTQIASILNVSLTTVLGYLKQCAVLGLCDYKGRLNNGGDMNKQIGTNY